MRVLITGNMGYVGPPLIAHLRRAFPQAQLVGYDTGFFGHCLTGARLLPETLLDLQIFGDVRTISADVFEGVTAVVHLAAISNDPMGSKFEDVTADINARSSIAVARMAAARGVKSFVFASSCSMYGSTDGGARKETDHLNPLTAYAKSKAATELGLATLDATSTTFTSLRFSTACGMSDRLRLDLVLNDFVACAVSSGKISVLSDGTPWRPLIDVKDMALAIEWAISRDAALSGGHLSVNVGADHMNYQVRDLALATSAAVPGTQVSINTDAPADRRSYQVDFTRFKELAPLHQPQVPLRQSISELKSGLGSMGFSDPEFRSSQYMRLGTLERHISEKRLNGKLQWLD